MKIFSLILIMLSLFSEMKGQNKFNQYSDVFEGKDTLQSTLVFKISKTEFWNDKDAFKDYFEDLNEQIDSNEVMPISFSISDSIVYIPNVITNSVLAYDWKGKLIKSYTDIPDESLEYMDLLPNGNFIFNSYNIYNLIEFNFESKKILFHHRAVHVPFHIFGNNCIFVDRDSFFDLKNIFQHFSPKEMKMSLSGFDFNMNNNTIFLIKLDTDKLFYLYSYNTKGIFVNRSQIKKIDKEYNGVNLLCAKKESVICVFSNYYKIPLICKINVENGKIINGTYLQNKLRHGRKIIGQKISAWPDGVIYKINEIENRLYCLETDDDSIYLYYYNLGKL